MKKLSFIFFPLVLGLFLITNTSLAAAKIRAVQPDKSNGFPKAVVVEPAPLAHTAQMLPLNAQGELVGRDNVAKQTEQVLKNLETVLRKAKSSRKEIVKLNVCVPRGEMSGEVSKVLAKSFTGKTKPAITFVGGELAHPDALVAMDAVAVARVKTTSAAPVHFLKTGTRFSEVTVLPPDGAVYVAGLADKNELSQAAHNTMQKIQDGIAHLGLKRSDIVQLKVFMFPMSEVKTVETAIGKFFDGETVPPLIFVNWISSSVPIEIEAIAAAAKSEANVPVTFHTPTGISASPVYSRLARVHSGNRVYISGLYGTSEPESDVRDIFAKLDELLQETGSNRDSMAKATYYFSEPASNARLDAFRPKFFNPKTPPTASKARVKDVGQPGRGIVIDMIAVSKQP